VWGERLSWPVKPDKTEGRDRIRSISRKTGWVGYRWKEQVAGGEVCREWQGALWDGCGKAESKRGDDDAYWLGGRGKKENAGGTRSS